MTYISVKAQKFLSTFVSTPSFQILLIIGINSLRRCCNIDFLFAQFTKKNSVTFNKILTFTEINNQAMEAAQEQERQALAVINKLIAGNDDGSK